MCTMKTTGRKAILRFLSLVSGLLGMTAAGVVGGFNVYANAVKETFNYTQTEIEVMASAGNIGEYLGIPASLLLSHCTPRWTMVTAMTMSTVGFALFWMAAKLKHVFTHYSAAVTAFYFIGAHGTVYTTMACLLVNMDNFSIKHIGKIVVLMDTLYCLGTPLVALLYSLLFSHSGVSGKDNLEDFLLFAAVMYVSVNGLCVIFINSYKEKTEDTDLETSPLIQQDGATSGTPIMSIRAMAKDWSIHFCVWQQVICVALGTMYTNNITTVLHSLNLDKLSTLFTSYLSLASTILTLIICSLTDYTEKWIRRSYFILVSVAVQLSAFAVLIFLIDNMALLIAITLLESLAFGCNWSLTSAVMGKRLGVRNFEKLWGIVLVFDAAAISLIQGVFGWIYESYITVKGGNDCFGPGCFTWIMVLSAGLNFCALILSIGVVGHGW